LLGRGARRRTSLNFAFISPMDGSSNGVRDSRGAHGYAAGDAGADQRAAGRRFRHREDVYDGICQNVFPGVLVSEEGRKVQEGIFRGNVPAVFLTQMEVLVTGGKLKRANVMSRPLLPSGDFLVHRTVNPRLRGGLGPARAIATGPQGSIHLERCLHVPHQLESFRAARASGAEGLHQERGPIQVCDDMGSHRRSDGGWSPPSQSEPPDDPRRQLQRRRSVFHADADERPSLRLLDP
jgi:hypothetical protein